MVQKSKSSGAEPSQRQLRVGEDLRHHLASILMRQETHIPALDSVSITVSEVSVSPDLSFARVYVMTLGGQDMDTVLPLLNQYDNDKSIFISCQMFVKMEKALIL